MIEQFKAGMGHLAGAVTIITTGSGPGAVGPGAVGPGAVGLTATAVCSLSMAPPRMLACLNRHGATFDTLARADAFCVNVLGVGGRALAETFAGRTGLSGADKFADTGWIFDEDAPPRHGDALTAIRCKVHSITLVATHAIVIGDVTAVWNRPDLAPLVYHDRTFQTLCPLS
jgi:flavin reductase (DIM6/NTAB) family NADH-FMN oxidoreductase RutF